MTGHMPGQGTLAFQVDAKQRCKYCLNEWLRCADHMEAEQPQEGVLSVE